MERIDNIIRKFNSYNKCIQIWAWHEITLPKIKRNLYELKIKNRY